MDKADKVHGEEDTDGSKDNVPLLLIPVRLTDWTLTVLVVPLSTEKLIRVKAWLKEKPTDVPADRLLDAVGEAYIRSGWSEALTDGE